LEDVETFLSSSISTALRIDWNADYCVTTVRFITWLTTLMFQYGKGLILKSKVFLLMNGLRIFILCY